MSRPTASRLARVASAAVATLLVGLASAGGGWLWWHHGRPAPPPAVAPAPSPEGPHTIPSPPPSTEEPTGATPTPQGERPGDQGSGAPTDSGTIRLTGDMPHRILFRDTADETYELGPLTPGVYTLHAAFAAGQPLAPVGQVTVRAGESATVQCAADEQRCW